MSTEHPHRGGNAESRPVTGAAEVDQTVSPSQDDGEQVRETTSGSVLWIAFRSLPPRVIIFGAVFVLLTVFFHVQSGGVFVTPRNLSLLLRQGAVVAIVASGVTVLIVMAEIDLSIGSAVFLSGVVAAQLSVTYGLPVAVAIGGAVVAGLLMGLIQGVWVVHLGIPSFVATLAGLLIWRGLGLMWTNAATIGPVDSSFSAVSEGFIPPTASYVLVAALLVAVVAVLVRGHQRVTQSHPKLRVGSSATWVKILGTIAALGAVAWVVGGFKGLPIAVLWAVALGSILYGLLTHTRFGRSAYLLGANRKAALYAGIAIDRVILRGFVLMGAVYGIAGVLLTARLGASTPSAGGFLELDAIAAAVIGGVSLRGGSGTIVGALMGALLLTTINNGMSILNVSSFAQLVVKGLILVAALSLDALAHRRSAR